MGRTFRAFIPKGYDTLEDAQSIAIGDLNNDGLDDVVLALRNVKEEKLNTSAVRYMVMLFKQNEGYKLAGVANHVILSQDEGGVHGDPFAGVYIKKGILNIDHYGGSAWKWTIEMKFRYQNGDFYLIGRTDDYYWTLGECGNIGDSGKNYEDINYVTGDRVRKKTNEDCKVLLSKTDKIKIRPLTKMADVKAINN